MQYAAVSRTVAKEKKVVKEIIELHGYMHLLSQQK